MKRTYRSKLSYNPSICDYCGVCVAVCPHDAINLMESDYEIDEQLCTLCRNCVFACPVKALEYVDETGI